VTTQVPAKNGKPAPAVAAGNGVRAARGAGSTKARGKPGVKATSADTVASVVAARPNSPSKAGKTSASRVPIESASEEAIAAGATRRKLPKGGPTKADLRRYRDALLERRRELLRSSAELEAGALQSSGGEFSVDHMADHGSDNYEQDFNLKLLEGEADRLAEIRDALAKIDGKGDLPYGLCEGCADTDQRQCETCPWIPPARLAAVPQARRCVQMQEREERR